MYRITAATAALLATTAIAQAGGVERNAFTTGILFEEGNYVELGYTFVNPSVSGALNPPAPAVGSGDMAASYGFATLSYHNDITDDFSLSVVVDAPIGADVSYPGPLGYPFALSEAELRSNQISIIARYELSDRFSVYGGLRMAEASGTIWVNAPGLSYSLEADSDIGYGYMIGAAYEIPDIALRVALTYFSEIDLSLSGLSGIAAGPTAAPPATVIPTNFEITLPDSLLLEAQSGIAEGTLLFGSIRWVDWSEFDITPGNYPPGALVSYADDTITYTLGMARRLNDDLVLLGSVNYEAQNGGFASNLGPTDGRLGVSVGARYEVNNWVLSGGVNYTWIGDANTQAGAFTTTFNDNTAVGAGIRIGYRF